MRSMLCISLLTLLAQSVHGAQPGDSAAGKRLHDVKCTGCHDTGVYTRKDRTVRSLDALKRQLDGCSHMAKENFSAAETQNIIKYLDEQFYKFR